MQRCLPQPKGIVAFCQQKTAETSINKKMQQDPASQTLPLSHNPPLMESNAEETTTKDSTRKSHQKELETTLAELTKTREEINRAKDSAMQSWLDSKPLLDHLEKLQSDLVSAKNRASMAALMISELESQFDTSNASISDKKDEELKAKRMIEELQMSLEQKHAEIEVLKFDTDHERRARGRLKQDRRVRRQTLRTLQLTLRAVRIESEALGASAAAALNYIKLSNTEQENIVQLTHEEYSALMRRANEEMTLAEWRVSVSMEQKQMVESRRDDALRRLKDCSAQSKSRKMGMEAEVVTENKEQYLKRETSKDYRRIRKRSNSNKTRNTPQANLESALDHGYPQKLPKKSSINSNRPMANKKKSSMLHQIKSFIVRNITKLFR